MQWFKIPSGDSECPDPKQLINLFVRLYHLVSDIWATYLLLAIDAETCKLYALN